MTLKLNGLLPSSRRGRIILLVAILLFAIAIAGLLYKKSADNKKKNLATEHAPSTSQYLDMDNATANKSIANKDYQTAVDTLILASHDAIGLNKPDQAKDILVVGLAKIPDASIPWYAYDTLAGIAKTLNDKTLEKQSLEKAIAKADPSGADGSSERVAFLKKRLAEIK